MSAMWVELKKSLPPGSSLVAPLSGAAARSLFATYLRHCGLVDALVAGAMVRTERVSAGAGWLRIRGGGRRREPELWAGEVGSSGCVEKWSMWGWDQMDWCVTLVCAPPRAGEKHE